MASQETAPTLFLDVKDQKYAYRYSGNIASTHPPLLFLQHFRGTMDHWDPKLINSLAAKRPILIFDNAGIGRSSGSVASSFSAAAHHVVTFLDAFLPTINRTQVDLLGHCIGGMAAQMVALNAPYLVRKLVLAATAPSAGEGVEDADLDRYVELKDNWKFHPEAEAGTFAGLFYSSNPAKDKEGLQWFARVNSSRLVEQPQLPYLNEPGTLRQLEALKSWQDTTQAAGGSFGRLGELGKVLAVNGDKDELTKWHNTWVFTKHIAQCNILRYPGSGHGFLNEHAEKFADHLAKWLDSDEVNPLAEEAESDDPF
jgi:pimeloyl-ACP methyl ester carboxylesterase